MKKNYVEKALFGLVLVVGMGMLWVVFFWPDSGGGDTVRCQMPLASTPVGGDFELSHDGASFSLADHRGQVVLIYMGYTHCPDVCPTSLALMGLAMRQLDEAQLARVQGVFISVDPERDSAQGLREYSGFFHPGILGVSGSEEQLAQFGWLYGAVWHRIEGDSAMGYAMDHSSKTYVIAPDGSLASILPHNASVDRIYESILSLLNEARSEKDRASQR